MNWRCGIFSGSAQGGFGTGWNEFVGFTTICTPRYTLSEQSDELRGRSQRIEQLKLMVEKLRHVIFGAKSEKIVLHLEQMELELEDRESTQAELEAAAERVSPSKGPKARPERKPLPEHLLREVVTHAPNRDGCPDCGGQLRQFGEDISEQLEYIPDTFKVIRHVRPKFSCSGCDRVVEAPAPSRPIERGLAGPGLLAHVIVSKFSDHLPLYRQSEIYARQGVEISRSTLAGWVGAASDLLDPLVDAIQKHVLAGRKLHADDTPIPVLSPGNGKTKTGRLWTYVRDDRPAGEDTAPAVWFTYSADRKGEHPRQHLENFNGALQADAYAGFHHLYGDHIYEAACWAHARRKFHEIHVIHASPTTEADRLSERAVSLASQGGLMGRAAMFHGARAVWNALLGNRAEAQRSAVETLSLFRRRDADYGPAFALALLRDSAQAHRIAAELERRYPEDTSVQFCYLPALRALEALNQDAPAKALEMTQAASPYDLAVPGTAYFTGASFFGALYPIYLRGLAYSRMGRATARQRSSFRKSWSIRESC